MAFTDMQGSCRQAAAPRFLPRAGRHGHGTEGCNYLLALDMEMDPIPGYEIASWERGYGDFELAPDLATLRRLPWLEATALVLCDVCGSTGRRCGLRLGRCCARSSSGLLLWGST